MKQYFKKTLALLLTVLMLASCFVINASALTYRTGVNGASSSYKSGRYYSNLTSITLTGDGRTDLVAVALSQLGYQEGAYEGAYSGTVSGGNNYVEYSYMAGDYVGIGYGGSDYPWCASFVSWCLYQSRNSPHGSNSQCARYHKGDTDYIWREISCSQWVNQLKGYTNYYRASAYRGGSYTPRYGDLIFFQNSNGPCHIGIVLYTSGGRVYTVEGNTSDASGLESNGGGVYFKNYSLSSSYIHSYGVLPYESDSSVQKIDYSGANPTTGLYVSNSVKYVYTTETGSTRTTNLPRFRMFEVTEVCSNGRLKINYNGLVGYISNNEDRVIQVTTTGSSGATSAPSVSDATKTALQTAIDSVKNISYTDYLESTLIQIRSAYSNAVTILSDSAATESDYTNATNTLNTLLAQKGTNGGGVRVTGLNTKITEGACNVFTPKFNYNSANNNWSATVSNANIAYTLNVVCEWDNSQQIWVIKSKSEGNGTSTPDITMSTDEILIACHVNPNDAVSVDSFNTLSAAPVGSAISFYGIQLLSTGEGLLENSFVSVGAYIRLHEPTSKNLVSGMSYTVSGIGTGAGDYDANLTDGIASKNINTMIGNWFGFNGVENSNTYVDSTYNDDAGDIIFDLGKEHDLTKIRVHLANIYAAGVPLPWKLAVAVSDDGVNFTEYEEWMPTIQGQDNHYTREYTYWSEMSVENLKGRYVKITVGVNGHWAFLNEIEVYGAACDGTTNLVSGSDYVLSGTGETYGSYTADLTDGVASDSWGDDMWAGDVWFGFKSDVAVSESTGVATETNTVNTKGTVTFDLGTSYDISKARIHFGYNKGMGITHPWGAYIAVSDDGVNFTEYETEFPVVQATTDSGYSYWCDLDGISGLSGRYVRITVGVNGTWSFLNEIEVYGTVTPVATEEPEVPVEPDYGIRGDINGDGQLKAVDYLMLKRYILGTLDTDNLPEGVDWRADYDGNGVVKAVDYIKLKRAILGN